MSNPIPVYTYPPQSYPMIPQYVYIAPPNTVSVYTGETIPVGTPLTIGMQDPTKSSVKLHGIVKVEDTYYLHRPKGKK